MRTEDTVVTLDELERRHIEQVLASVRGNKSKAARLLGFDRTTLHRKLARWKADVTHDGVSQNRELADDHAPIVKRKRVRSKRSRPRKKTISTKKITRRMLHDFNVELEDVVDDEERPRHRGECRGESRPCPWVGCKHHLYLDINPETGSITINFPEIEPWDLPHSCSLDVADLGGVTLEGVGVYLNLTRERIRQVEVKAAIALKPHVQNLGVDSPVSPGCASVEPHADGENNALY